MAKGTRPHWGSVDESLLCVTRDRRDAWASFVLRRDGIVHHPDGHATIRLLLLRME